VRGSVGDAQDPPRFAATVQGPSRAARAVIGNRLLRVADVFAPVRELAKTFCLAPDWFCDLFCVQS